MSLVIAIDGPAGSGKGTITKLVANKLNLIYIDTGATYRAITYLVLKNNIDVTDNKKIVQLAKNSNIYFNEDGNIFVNDLDITNEIRSKEVSSIVSQISSIVELREIMVDLQRKMAKDKAVIMEGRDITTVVFPNASYKFYLDASVEERAKRRYKQNIKQGIDMSYDDILENIKNRDYNDMHKEVGALKRCDDQIYIDTTNLSIDEVVNTIIGYIEGVD
ncbi:MAG: (d)CMP kinase [Bacilli bacterium]|nr:(d)CMP kinase [Bacilli bacterium]